MWPTNRLPFSAIATIDGVVLYPPRFGITEGVPSSTIATHELVVPRSMPITLSLAMASYFPPVFGELPVLVLRMREQSSDLGQIVAKLRREDIVLALDGHGHDQDLLGV